MFKRSASKGAEWRTVRHYCFICGKWATMTATVTVEGFSPRTNVTCEDHVPATENLGWLERQTGRAVTVSLTSVPPPWFVVAGA